MYVRSRFFVLHVLAWFFALAFVQVAESAQPQWGKSGECTATTPCARYWSTPTDAATQIAQDGLTADNVANPNFPRFWVGPITPSAFTYAGSGANYVGSRPARWINGSTPVAVSEGFNVVPACQTPWPSGSNPYLPRGTDPNTACTDGANVCPQNDKSVVNLTQFWGTVAGYSPDGRAIVKDASGNFSEPASPTTICMRGCQWVADGAQIDFWVSNAPDASNGMYRASVDQGYMTNGSTCGATTAAADPTNKPPCPGSLGTVNGVTTCVKSQSVTAPGGAGNLPTTGNATAGGTGGAITPDVTSSGTAQKSGPNGEMFGKPTDTLGTCTGCVQGLPGNSTAGATTTTTTVTGSVTVDLSNIPVNCDKYPNTVGCSLFGTPDNSVALGHRDSGFSSITPVSFASSVTCPADLTFSVLGHAYAISYSSFCTDANTYIKPVVLVLGVALAAFVFVGGFRS